MKYSDVKTLTPAQRAVAELLDRGATRREIADKLHLAAQTVRSHVQAIKEKFDLEVVEHVGLRRQSGGPTVQVLHLGAGGMRVDTRPVGALRRRTGA